MNFFLPLSKGKPDGEGENLQKAIKNIFTHSKEIVDGYLAINSLYRSTIERSLTEVDAAPLLEATSTFHKDLTSATERFQDCLCDLLSMCAAMDPIIASAPDAALPLMTNLYSSFSRQLCIFYSDISAASSLNGKLFQKGALDIVSHQEEKRAISSPGMGSQKLPDSGRGALDNRGDAQSSSTKVCTDVSPSNKAEDAVAGDQPKERKPSLDIGDNVEEESISFPSSPAGFDVSQRYVDPLNESKKRIKRKRIIKVKSSASSTNSRGYPPRIYTLTPSDLPTFLPVVSTIEEALGNVVWSKRPDSYSFLHQIFAKSRDLQYHLEFPRGNTLADWVLDLYLDASPSFLSELVRELLPRTTSSLGMEDEEDEVHYGPFQTIEGPLPFYSQHVEGDEEGGGNHPREEGKLLPFSPFPSCAWRQIYRVRDPSLRFHTMFMFLQGPPPRGRFVVIHEVLQLAREAKEEVVHVVEEVDEGGGLQQLHTDSTPVRFARVSVYMSSSGGGHSSSSTISAPLLIMKWLRRQNGVRNYKEVSESDVLAETSAVLGSSYMDLLSSKSPLKNSTAFGRHKLSLDQATGADSVVSVSSQKVDQLPPPFPPPPLLGSSFVPISVQLASLEKPTLPGDTSVSPSFGAAVDAVTKGVTTVFTAPLTIGKAFMELTSGNDSLLQRRHLEEALQRACPELKEQEILNASSCEYSTRNGMSVPVEGAFYVLPRCICFLCSSVVLGNGGGGPPPIQLEYEDIKEVKKCRVERSEAIEVASHIGECFTLTNLNDRNTTYSIFVKQWLNT